VKAALAHAGRLAGRWEGLLALLLVVTVVYADSTLPSFLTGLNLSAASAEFSERALMALTLTLIVIAGEIDLSIASILGVSSAVFGRLIEGGMPLGLAVAVCLLTGAACGALNGLLIVRLRLPSLMVTIGTLALFRGIANGMLGTEKVTQFPTAVTNFGYDYVPGTLVPWAVLVVVVVAIPVAFLLHATRWGRAIFAIGQNREAARFAGISADGIRFWLFVASGLACALAGMMLTARLGSSGADNGLGFELDVVAVVLLGGVSIYGGRGTLLGVALAVLLVNALQNALSLNDVSSDVQQIVVGSLLVLSALAGGGTHLLRERLRARSASRDGPDAAPLARPEPQLDDA